MLQRVRPTHLDPGLPKLKGRGTVEVTETQARVLAVREATGGFSLLPAHLSTSLCSHLFYFLQPHWPLWWSSNLPRTVLPQGLHTCPSTTWNTLLCILASCLPLSQYPLQCHILRKASDYPLSNGMPLSLLPSFIFLYYEADWISPCLWTASSLDGKLQEGKSLSW